MSRPRWTRQGKLSGPANVLDQRWEVRGNGTAWGVWDRQTGTYMGERAGFRTMRAARQAAEELASLAQGPR